MGLKRPSGVAVVVVFMFLSMDSTFASISSVQPRFFRNEVPTSRVNQSNNLDSQQQKSPENRSVVTPITVQSESSNGLQFSVLSGFPFSCPAGKKGSVVCSPCVYPDDATHSQCNTCPSDQYPYASFDSCAVCPPGMEIQGTNCVACTSGKYSLLTGISAVCTDCPAGTFSAPGSYACSPCAAGYKENSLCSACDDNTLSIPGSSKCSSCPAGTFESTTCTDCVDGVKVDVGGQCVGCLVGPTGAKSCITCNAGFKYVSQACVACENGKYSDAGSTDCYSCPQNFFTTGSSCQACDPGKYSSPGVTSCSACVPGTYIDSGACLECPIGKYSMYPGQSQCNDCPFMLTDKIHCRVCESGSYFDGISCVTCPIGTYSSQGATQCHGCPANYAVSKTQSGTINCIKCPVNMVSNPGATQCSKCSVADPRSVCVSCPSGTYSPHHGRETCIECTGNVGTSGSECTICGENLKLSEGMCEACPIDTYSPFGANSCSQCPWGHFTGAGCTECGPNTYASPGQSQCSECPAGYFSTPSSACQMCEKGTYTAVPGQTQCDECLNSDAGQSICLECGVNHYRDGTECRACPANTFAAKGSVRCSSCPESYKLNPTCSVCSANMFATPGQTQCDACSSGYFHVHDRCAACPEGYYAPTSNSHSCMLCPTRATYSGPAAAICSHCPMNYKIDANYQCIACPAAKYSVPGQTECSDPSTQCPTNTVSQPGGKCQACPPTSPFAKPGAQHCRPCQDNYILVSNSVCQACPDGKQSLGTSLTCSACPLSIPYSFPSKGISCTRCPVGYLAVGDFCRACPANYYRASDSCINCPSGRYSAPASDECSVCVSNQRSSGSSCENCPAGKYAAAGQSTCSKCPPGYFVLSGDGASSCAACPSGKYSNIAGATACTDCASVTPHSWYGSNICSSCPANFVLQGTTCTACPSGEYATPGQTSCHRCNAGTYFDTPSSLCVVATAGHYVGISGQTEPSMCPSSMPFSSPGSYTCRTCAPGYVYNQTQCQACPEGKYSSQHQYECHDCPPSQPYSHPSWVPNVPCRQCDIGFVLSSGRCVACPQDYYFTSAETCAACPPGKYASLAATECSICNDHMYVTPGACQACASSSYASPGQTECSECSIGKYKTGTECTACEAGKTTLIVGQSQCSDCSGESCFMCLNDQSITIKPFAADVADIFSDPNSCNVCPVSKYSTGSQTECSGCPANFKTLITCSACPSGWYSSPGQKSCSTCSAGKYSSSATSTVCYDCPAAYFSIHPGSTQCNECDPTTPYAPEGSVACQHECPAGRFLKTGTSRTRCLLCPSGTYNTDADVTICSACPPYMISRSGSTQCVMCPDGQVPDASGSRCQAFDMLPKIAWRVVDAIILHLAVFSVQLTAIPQIGALAELSRKMKSMGLSPQHLIGAILDLVLIAISTGITVGMDRVYLALGVISIILCFAGTILTSLGFLPQTSAIDLIVINTLVLVYSGLRFQTQSYHTSTSALSMGTMLFGFSIILIALLSVLRTRAWILSDTQGKIEPILRSLALPYILCLGVMAIAMLQKSLSQPEYSTSLLEIQNLRVVVSMFEMFGIAVVCIAMVVRYAKGVIENEKCDKAVATVMKNHRENKNAVVIATGINTLMEMIFSGDCPTIEITNTRDYTTCTIFERATRTFAESPIDLTPGSLNNFRTKVVGHLEGQFINAADPTVQKRIFQQSLSVLGIPVIARECNILDVQLAPEALSRELDSNVKKFLGQLLKHVLELVAPKPFGLLPSGISRVLQAMPVNGWTVLAIIIIVVMISGLGNMMSDTLEQSRFADQQLETMIQARATQTYILLPVAIVLTYVFSIVRFYLQMSAQPCEGPQCYMCENGKFAKMTSESKDKLIECIACDAGKYTSTYAATECTVCPAGRYVPPEKNACKACPKGYFRDDTNTDDCTACPEKYFADKFGQSKCNLCPAHYEAKGKGNTECTSCVPGKHRITESLCVACEAGKIFESGHSKCRSCMAGKYAPHAGFIECLTCPDGHIPAKESGSGITQYFVDNANLLLGGATICIPCPANQIVSIVPSAPTCINQTQPDCYPEYKCSDSCHGSLQNPCPKCPLGKASLDDSSPCEYCSVGKYQSTSQSNGVNECKACDAGKYQNEITIHHTARTECANCPAGKISDSGSKSECTYCGLGTYQDEIGKSTCKPCPVNEIQTTQTIKITHGKKCHPCKSGEFFDNFECKPCGEGRYQDAEGQSECKLCDEGSFQDKTTLQETHGITCSACDALNYQDVKGQSECKPCTSPLTRSPDGKSCS